MEQPGLFDAEAAGIPDVRLTLNESPLGHLVRSSRVGFLAGMLALWIYDGKPTRAQKERLEEIARETLLRAQEGAGNG